VIERSLAIQQLNTNMSISVKSNRALFDLDLLRAIVVVADCGSFTTAAARALDPVDHQPKGAPPGGHGRPSPVGAG
jgi:hypothetical protein